MEMFASTALLNRLPEKVAENTALSTIFRERGLDWEVLQKPVQDNVVDVKNAVINYRSDNNGFLGIVSGSHYKPVNNIDAFNFVDGLKDFDIETAGSLQDGKKIFVVGKMHEEYEIVTGDTVTQYISFIHGHTGKEGIQILLTPIRMFCTNQLNIMLKTASFKYSIRHNGDVYNKIANVEAAFNMAKKYMFELCNELRGMTTQKARLTIDQFLDRLFPKEEAVTVRTLSKREQIVGRIRDIYNNKPDNQNYKGSNFGILNAVSDFVSHQNSKQRSSDTDVRKFFSTIENNTLLDNAYNILMVA